MVLAEIAVPRSPNTRARRTAPADATPYERLLAAATAKFTSRGYAATSVREIVEQAGVTKPVLYYYFGSKEGIYLALVGRLLAEFEALLAEGREHRGTARERITEMCTDLFDLVRQRLDIVRFFYAVFYGAPQSAPYFEFNVFPRRFREAVETALRDGLAAGEIRDFRFRDIVTAIEATLNIATEIALTEPDRNFTSRDLARLINVVFTGVAVPAAVATPRAATRRITTRESSR